MACGRFYFANIAYSLEARQKTSVDMKWASGIGTKEGSFGCSFLSWQEGFSHIYKGININGSSDLAFSIVSFDI